MLEEIATKEEVHVLFSNVQQLIEVSKMLLTDMVQRVKETNGDELGDSFLLFVRIPYIPRTAGPQS